MSNTARTLSVISSAFSLLVLVCCSYVELKKSQVYVLIGEVTNPPTPNSQNGALAGVGLGSIL
jgi:hypothetical protein